MNEDIWPELVRSFDKCHSLFLVEISEPAEKALKLVLREGKVLPYIESVEVGGVQINGLQRVEVTEDSRVLELTWTQYIAYSVTNESFAQPEGTQTPDSGRLLRRYSDSSFLAHVALSTFATSAYPGPHQHIQVLSENHIVDVVSTVIPELQLVDGRRSISRVQ